MSEYEVPPEEDLAQIIGNPGYRDKERLSYVHHEWEKIKKAREQELTHEDWCEDPNCTYGERP
jgi:hypothetical protein